MALFNAGSVGFLVLGVAIGISLSKVYSIDRYPQSSAEENRTHHHGGSIAPPILASGRTPPPPPPASFLEEYLPASLLRDYGPESLQFPVTRSMLRRSRPVVGNVRRLHAYLGKLRAGECTTALVLGGSVSDGHNVLHPERNAYPVRFRQWLNKRYPCETRDGAKGTHAVKKLRGAPSSQALVSSWSTVEAIGDVDLVFVEFNVNDHFISGLPHRLEDKGPLGNTTEYISLWYSEVLLRRLLLARTPDPPAIVTFNADYVGRNWADPPLDDPEKARKTLFRRNQEPLKNWLSSMYEVPVFSAVAWTLPLAGKRGSAMQFNRTSNPYSTKNWHVDRCCHPRAEGHLILNLVLAYCMVEEEKAMLSGDEADAAHVETDFTAGRTPVLRDPIYLSPEEESLYVRNDSPYAGVDFTDPGGGSGKWEGIVVASEGWTWRAEGAEGDKFGFVADGVEGGQHIAISLEGGRHGVVEVSYVVSYENFGVALAWLDDAIEKKDRREVCKKEASKRKGGVHKGGMHHLVAIWDEMASVPKVELLQEKLEEDEKRILHVCLTPRSSKIAVGSGNKFKLLGVRVY